MVLDFLESVVSKDKLAFFQEQAEQKIESEGWAKQGRNVAVKTENFVNCWITEEAFKQLLIKKNIWFRHRGIYFGDSQGAGYDFTARIKGAEISVGLRSIAISSLARWKSVAYPDDRFREEQEKIAEFHIVCYHKNGKTKFFGVINKEKLLDYLTFSSRIYSKKNQEYFRTIPLEKFRFTDLVCLLEEMDKV